MMPIWLPEDNDYCIRPLEKKHLNDFECDSELNQYFKVSAFDNEDDLISKNYAFIRKKDNLPCALFNISNAEIKSCIETDMVMNENSKYKSYPAVRIGRFVTRKDLVKTGIGRNLLFLIKVWFVISNKTGCRYIVVDSRKEAVEFYKKCGFETYPEQDVNSKNDILYFDLKPFELKIKSIIQSGISDSN